MCLVRLTRLQVSGGRMRSVLALTAVRCNRVMATTRSVRAILFLLLMMQLSIS